MRGLFLAAFIVLILIASFFAGGAIGQTLTDKELDDHIQTCALRSPVPSRIGELMLRANPPRNVDAETLQFRESCRMLREEHVRRRAEKKAAPLVGPTVGEPPEKFTKDRDAIKDAAKRLK